MFAGKIHSSVRVCVELSLALSLNFILKSKGKIVSENGPGDAVSVSKQKLR